MTQYMCECNDSSNDDGDLCVKMQPLETEFELRCMIVDDMATTTTSTMLTRQTCILIGKKPYITHTRNTNNITCGVRVRSCKRCKSKKYECV